MNQYDICFNNAFSAWEAWNMTDKVQRFHVLEQAFSNLPNVLAIAGQVQLLNAQSLVEPVHQLMGPTGETNELYTSGRGVALLVVDDASDQAKRAAIAMAAAILQAGNSVIICCDESELTQNFESVGRSLHDNAHLIQCLPVDAYRALSNKAIMNFAYIGNEQAEREINALLAARAGAIVALVSETDLVELPQSQDPQLALRFITERTRTINITAVGGNATLLELGSET